MPRRSRFVLPGVAHHLTQRGNNGEAVLRNPEDRNAYLKILKSEAQVHGTRILGYCVMTNHVHLVAIPEHEESFANTLRQAHSLYAAHWNHTQQHSGHVWQGRYFSCPLDESHLFTALRYVEQNPIRAGIVADAWEWDWSSARAHVAETKDDAVLDRGWSEYLGLWNYREWRDILGFDRDIRDEKWNELRHATLAGEPFGSADFVSRMEGIAGRRLRVFSRGRPHKATCRMDFPTQASLIY